MDPINFGLITKNLASMLAQRARERKVDQVLFLLGLQNEKLEEINVTLQRLENKIGALILRPLKAGHLKLQEVDRLPGSLKASALGNALNDFDDMIALPYDGSIGDVDMQTLKAMAYFGKASVLAQAEADVELVSETSLQGFIHSAAVGKLYLANDIWKKLVQDVFLGKAILKLNTSADLESPYGKDEDIKYHTVDASLRIKKLEEDVYYTFSDSELSDDDIYVNFGENSALNVSPNSEMIATCENGFYGLRVDAKIHHHQTIGHRMTGQTTFNNIYNENGVMKSHFEPGNLYTLRVYITKSQSGGGSHNAEYSCSTRITLETVTCIDTHGHDYKTLIEPKI